MKSVHIRSFRGPYFLAFGLNTESECGKIRTRKTPNMNTFHAVQKNWLFNSKQTSSVTQVSPVMLPREDFPVLKC